MRKELERRRELDDLEENAQKAPVSGGMEVQQLLDAWRNLVRRCNSQSEISALKGCTKIMMNISCTHCAMWNELLQTWALNIAPRSIKISAHVLSSLAWTGVYRTATLVCPRGREKNTFVLLMRFSSHMPDLPSERLRVSLGKLDMPCWWSQKDGHTWPAFSVTAPITVMMAMSGNIYQRSPAKTWNGGNRSSPP
jgi:hypothetical protein